ncbi:MAG: hypothetical protein ACLUPL_03440 [Butyricimonas virosa]
MKLYLSSIIRSVAPGLPEESAFQASVAGKYMTDGYKKQNATY